MMNEKYLGERLQEAREKYKSFISLITSGYVTPPVIERTKKARDEAKLWEETCFNSTPLELASEIIRR